MKVVLFVRRSSSLQLETEGQSPVVQEHLYKLREVVSESMIVVTIPLDREVS